MSSLDYFSNLYHLELEAHQEAMKVILLRLFEGMKMARNSMDPEKIRQAISFGEGLAKEAGCAKGEDERHRCKICDGLEELRVLL